MKPDALIEIRLMTPKEGGRKTPINGQYYACPLFVDGEAFECRFFTHGKILELGQTYQLPVKFMNPDLVLPKLGVGKTVILWEGKDIGVGKVLRQS